MKCQFPSCDTRAMARGLCQAHNLQLKKGGPLRPKRKLLLGKEPESRIDGRYSVNSKTGCHDWLGNRNPSGYGTLTYMGQMWLAHRFVYSNKVGPIPRGMHVCHKCDNPGCVNAKHLFLGTDKTNADDKIAKRRHPAQSITHCIRGHKKTKANRYFDGGGKSHCLDCIRVRSTAKYRERFKNQSGCGSDGTSRERD